MSGRWIAMPAGRAANGRRTAVLAGHGKTAARRGWAAGRRWIAALAGLALAGAAQAQVRVAASTAVLADMARQIGGDAVRVTALVPVGAAPYAWQLDADARRFVQSADLVLLHGAGMEPWADEAADMARGEVLALAAGVELERTRWFVGTALDPNPDRLAGEKPIKWPDPHAYLDAEKGAQYAGLIAQALAAAAPDRAGYWKQGAARYAQAIRDRRKANLKAVKKARARHKVLLALSDSFRYLRKPYGMRTSALADVLRGGDKAVGKAKTFGGYLRRRRARVLAALAEGDRGYPAVQNLVRAARGKWGPPLHVRLRSRGQGPSTYLELLDSNAQALAQGFAAPAN